MNSVDNDMLSSKAGCGSGSDDSMNLSEASNSSTPHNGSPPPFATQVEGTAGWVTESARFDERYLLGVELLIPRNSEEAKGISQGHDRALEKLRLYDEMTMELTPFNSTNTSTISRRRHFDAIGDQQNTNAMWHNLGEDDFEDTVSMPRGPFDSPFAKRTADDPEKQEPVNGSSTNRRKHHRQAEYTLLVLALCLGFVWYNFWTWEACSEVLKMFRQ